MARSLDIIHLVKDMCLPLGLFFCTSMKLEYGGDLLLGKKERLVYTSLVDGFQQMFGIGVLGTEMVCLGWPTFLALHFRLCSSLSHHSLF